MGIGNNAVHIIDSTELHVKYAQQLLPVDITLHPIYRPDGMMLVNRYTTLLPYTLNQIRKHLKDDMLIPIIVTTSEEMLNNFIDSEIYSNPEFVLFLDNALRDSMQWYSVPLSIEEFVDERVDLKSTMRAVADLKSNKEKGVHDIKEEKKTQIASGNNDVINRYSILGKITSSASIWGTFENRLSSNELQNKAKTLKKRFLNILNDDNSLMELIIKISIYDDLLLIHGVNTACLSLIFGIACGMPDEELLNLAITSMFCNIGFVNADKDTFYQYLKGTSNPGIIGEHIKNSLEIIAVSPTCRNKSVIFGILEHHEAFNGSGAPAGKKGKDISMFGRILGITLKYETYLKEYFHGDISNLDNIEKMLCRNKENKYDQDILNAFMRNSVAFR